MLELTGQRCPAKRYSSRIDDDEDSVVMSLLRERHREV